ncbi:CLPTM1L [Symbiodinium natans]|uniref:CLPTM1L protein n=1 Tax=Symbiodinium natans TaxID=878477 RepID=A0A812L410_9DINO|nr:CLPTM1L [Symbiodinium natans]
MGTVLRAFQALFAWYLVSVAWQLYSAFHAPRCPTDLEQQPCYRPLFQKGELVNISVFLTTNKTLRWWSDEGFEQLVPFFNATVSYGQPSQLQAALPLSRSQLQSVRRNESVLLVHCFLIRAAARLSDEIRSSPHPGLAGIVSDNALHTTSQIVKTLPQVQRQRRNLLAQQQNDSHTSEHSVEVTLRSGWTISIYPRSCAFWAGSLFFVSHFFEPTLFLAALRHGLLAVVVPFLVQLSSSEAVSGDVAAHTALQVPAKADKIPHLVPVLRMELAADSEAYDGRYPPPLLYKELLIEHGLAVRERDVRYTLLPPRHAEGPKYAPPFYVDTASYHSKTWTPLDSNVSRSDPDMYIEVEFTGMLKYSIVQTFREAMKMYLQMGIREQDLEDLKDFFFRQPIHVMIAYQVVGFLQMTLRMLAFKNDITFFKGRSDYTGLSSRSLATDTIQEIVIFFYLYDFDSISRLLLLQLGMSAAISFWKYARVARLGTRWSYFLPWAKYGRCMANSPEDCQEVGEAFTEEVDARGMRYLKYILYPLSAAWGLYSLYHYSYKSWWSWMVSSMADFAYTFGFVNMMPQIFINYKLKSVAHMPWRVLMYKFFNTFIDDIFAFVIAADQMTNKHRYMTLRDDVIFFVFLYQRHIYKVDPSRPDEFGNVYDDKPAPEQVPLASAD